MKWEGRCRDCGQWNTLQQSVAPAVRRSTSARPSHIGHEKPVRLDQCVAEANFERHKTGFSELDRVLGGGLIEGSYILLGGPPGIGKSTLLMQMAGGLSQHVPGGVLYVSGEESVNQTALRAQRLGVRSQHIQVASLNQIEAILQLMGQVKPRVLVIDSIQTLYCAELSSAPGTVSQVRECAHQLMQLAKSQNTCVILVGHITKDGSLAGPKTLEHMVDTVLSFEGDNNQEFRLLRAQKNRFGSTNELGVFCMKEAGLEEVPNPSEIFLSQSLQNPLGSAVFSALEGTRPLLCEVQALTVFSQMPRCTCVGFDLQRANILVAVLDKNLKLGLGRHDVFVNVVGGLRLTEPAADLAVAAALISTTKNKTWGKTCFFGEVGLTGEVRAVKSADTRCLEAIKLGFKKFVVPEGGHLKPVQKKHPQIKFHFVEHILHLAKCAEMR